MPKMVHKNLSTIHFLGIIFTKLDAYKILEKKKINLILSITKKKMSELGEYNHQEQKENSRKIFLAEKVIKLSLTDI